MRKLIASLSVVISGCAAPIADWSQDRIDHPELGFSYEEPPNSAVRVLLSPLVWTLVSYGLYRPGYHLTEEPTDWEPEVDGRRPDLLARVQYAGGLGIWRLELLFYCLSTTRKPTLAAQLSAFATQPGPELARPILEALELKLAESFRDQPVRAGAKAPVAACIAASTSVCLAHSWQKVDSCLSDLACLLPISDQSSLLIYAPVSTYSSSYNDTARDMVDVFDGIVDSIVVDPKANCS